MTEWEVRPLGDVCRVVNGGTPKTSVPEYWGGEHRWITPAEMGKRPSPYVADTSRRLTSLGLSNCSASLSPANSVILSTRAPIGHLVINTEPMATNQGCRTLVPGSGVHDKYLYFYLDSIRDVLDALGTGATFRELSAGVLKRVTIPVPSLPEQQQIVRILEEAFEGIAAARVNAEKNLRNACALFERYLQSIFTRRGEDWTERRLGDFATFRNGVNFTKSSRGESVKIVGVKDFRNRFWAPLDNLDTATTDGALPDSDVLRKNDLLFVRSNGNIDLIGRSLLAGEVHEKTTHSGFTIRARLNERGVSPHYLCHFVKSSEARRQMVAGGTGTNIKSLNQSILSALVVPIPPIAEQSRIVRQLEAMDAESQRLESIYQRKLAALDELKKSILHQAFSGQL